MIRPFSLAARPLAALALGAALILAAAPAQAVVIFEDDFETGTLAGDGWVTNVGTITLGATHQSAFGPAGDARGVRVFDNSAATAPSLYHNFSIPAPYQNYPLGINFDFKFTNSTGNAAFRLTDGVSGNGLKLHLAAGPVSGVSNLQYRSSDPGGSFVTLNAMEPGEWYRFSLLVEPASTVPDSFSLRVQSFDGALDAYYSGLPFQSQLTSFSRIEFYTNTAASGIGNDFTIDNVHLMMVVPEPSTLVLGLPAMALVLGYGVRRRRRSRNG